MIPAYAPGEYLWALRCWRPLRVGDVIVLSDPSDSTRELIKRVVRVTGRDLWVEGDNTGASRDSREFGVVPRRDARFLVVPKR